MRKILLTTIAVALFAFYTFGFVQWLHSGHNFRDVWRATTSDWFLAVAVLDMSLFSLLCLIWLWRDMGKQNFSPGRKLLLLSATLLSGVVVLLLYLAFRKPATLEEP